MNDGVKRYHETGNLESNALCKKPKNTLTGESAKNQVLPVRSSSIFLVDFEGLETSSQASKGILTEEDAHNPSLPIASSSSVFLANLEGPETNSQTSNVNSSSSSVKVEYSDASDVRSGNKISNDGSTTSKLETDQVWFIDDIEVKNESSEIDYPMLNAELKASCESDESSYSSSTNVLYARPSSKEDNVPSSSGSQNSFTGSQQAFEPSSTVVKTEVIEIDESSDKSDDEVDDIPILNKSPDCDMALPELIPSKNHSIMFSPETLAPGVAPLPFPHQYKDRWDPDHVHLPCSPLNKYPVENSLTLTEPLCIIELTEPLCIIEQLLLNPFRLKSLSEKLKIVQNGRPCPELPESPHQGKNARHVRHFSISHYSSIDWIAGCSSRNKLFCWPCLLFTTEKNVWSKSGFSKFYNLYNATQKHEKSRTHIFASLQLKIFQSAHANHQFGAEMCPTTAQHNDSVWKNREILKRVIDAVCFLVTHELPFSVHNEGDDSHNKGVYLGILDLLSKYDVILSSHLKSSAMFHETSSKIPNDIICAVGDVVLETIKEEIKQSKFVAIILNETSDVINASQMSTTLRYVNSDTGIVHERFISFTNVSADRSADGLLQHVIKIVNEFELSDKLVSQTFDGAVVMFDHTSGLVAKVEELYPKAIFVHCFSHNLSLILSQSVSWLKECRIFFQTLTGLGSFFQICSRRTHGLNEFISKQVPKATAPTCVNFSTCLVNTVKEHHALFVRFFQHILDECLNWDSETVVAAHGFLKFLTNPHTTFLLFTFGRIFSYTDVLCNILQSKHLDIFYCTQEILHAKHHIMNLRNHSELIWSETQEYHENYLPSKCSGEDLLVSRKALYFKIIDNVIVQLEERFGSLDQLKFASLLDPNKFDTYKVNFPHASFEKLNESYNDMFDFVKLKSELLVLYAYKGFLNTQPYQLLNELKSKQLETVLSEVYKLGSLILTVPSTTASVDTSFSALKRIKSHQKCTQGQEHVPDLALLSIEKNLLHELRSTHMFYEAVTTEFTKQKTRMEFTYK